VVTRLRVVLSEVKLETGPGSGEVEMKTAPLLIDLLQPDLESGTRAKWTSPTARGDYRELSSRSTSRRSAIPAGPRQRPLLDGVGERVRHRGRYRRREAFHLQIRVDAQQTLEGPSPSATAATT